MSSIKSYIDGYREHQENLALHAINCRMLRTWLVHAFVEKHILSQCCVYWSQHILFNLVCFRSRSLYTIRSDPQSITTNEIFCTTLDQGSKVTAFMISYTSCSGHWALSNNTELPSKQSYQYKYLEGNSTVCNLYWSYFQEWCTDSLRLTTLHISTEPTTKAASARGLDLDPITNMLCTRRLQPIWWLVWSL